jgi:hypothetical protein
VEERRRGKAGSGHHATESGHHATGSSLHGPRPPDPRGEERVEGERHRIRLREREGGGAPAWEEEGEGGGAPAWEKERVAVPMSSEGRGVGRRGCVRLSG